MVWRNKKTRTEGGKNNRINLIMAIIFVSGGLLVAKLAQLQVLEYDHYYNAALRQQQAKGVLQAVRGKIFIQDNKGDAVDGELFPLATNKQMAVVFARPDKITEAQKTAEALYALLDEARVAIEVDKLIAEDQELMKESAEFRAMKRELEIKARKEKTISEYTSKFSKPDDAYEKIADKVDEETVEKLKELKLAGIDYAMEANRFYPEKNVGSHIVGFMGYSGDARTGRYGLEGFFDKELAGTNGRVLADRNALGELIVMNDQDYVRPRDGSDLILTINRSLQFEACNKLKEAVRKHGADGGSVIIMEPKTGAIMAMCAYPDYDPNDYRAVGDINVFNNAAIFSLYEPGSTFKSITMAAALDQEKVTPTTVYDDKGFIMIEGWPKPIKNSDFESFGGHGRTDMNAVLEKSLNTGAIFAMLQIGPATFADYVKKFGFGEKTGIELETESAGDIANLTGKKIRPVNAATASFGQGISVTPLQMITAYAAIANGGMLMQPFVVKAIAGQAGEKNITQPKQIRRVISARAATLLSGMLTNAVEKGHAQRAKVSGYYVAGKTGTAQVANIAEKGYGDKTIHSFIGFTPVNDPKFIMLTRLDDPKDANFAESTAVPLFGDIAKFVLSYYQVPTERKD